MSFKLLEINIRKRMFSLQDKTKKGGGAVLYNCTDIFRILYHGTHGCLFGRDKERKNGGKERESRDTQKVKSNPSRGLPRHSDTYFPRTQRGKEDGCTMQ